MTNKELIQSNYLMGFAKKINPNKLLEIIPVKTESFAIKNECFENVKKQLTIKGGKIIYGWSVHPHIINGMLIFLEAEAHAIWVDGQKTKICISPQKDKSIIFLEDNNDFVKNNNPIPSFRMPIQKDVEIINFMKVKEIKDFTNIKMFKYINSKLGEQKKKLPIKGSLNKSDELIISYGNDNIIVKEEQIIKLFVLLARAKQIESAPQNFDLTSEIYNFSKEIDYKFEFFIQP